MKKYIIFAFAALLITGCRESSSRKSETPTRGHAAILVDETVFPLIEGVAQVYESEYKYASFDLLAEPEHEVSLLLKSDSLKLAVITRELNASEQAWFESQRITPRVTEIGYDAIALITNRESRDTMISTAALKNLLQGKDSGRTLVFDNPASSTLRYMKELAGVYSIAGVYSLQTNADVIKYVSETPHTIGVVGVNWLYEADSLQRQFVDKVRVLSVGDDVNGYFKPVQNDIAEGNYPLIRKLYFVNGQGTAGLGMGFASFIAGDVGQRIVLKAGLVPIIYPKREIIIRKQL